MMDFQVVVLAGGFETKLVPLVSKLDIPKALLPVANRPLLSYVLELLEQNNLNNLILVVEGESAALLVGGWISSAYIDRLHVEVVAVPEDVGTAGALRAIDHYLTASDILVVSGDLVCDVPPGAIASAHRRHDAVVTAMLCSSPVSGGLSDSGSSGGKDKAKKPGRHNIIGLDPTNHFLVHIASGAELHKDTRVQKNILRAVGQMEMRSDLMDAHMYAFKRSILQEVLRQKDTFWSLKSDVVPYLVKSQLRSNLATTEVHTEENGYDKDCSGNSEVMLPQLFANASTRSFHEQYGQIFNGCVPFLTKTHKCCVYIASKSNYCARLNSIQAFNDINRDVMGDANYLSGYNFSAQNNIIHPSAVLGSRTTVGSQCMLGEGSEIGDKCSVKKSVIGRHCRIGSNVKIANSVVMNYVTIGDGCSIQGSVVCSNVQLQERVVFKDCQIGAGYVVTSGSEYKGESLAKIEKQ